MASLKYWLWLTNLEGLTIQQRLALLEHFGQPDKVYFGDSDEYALVEGMTRQAMAALADKSLDGADKILGDCQSLGLRIITIQDAEYPDRLRNIYDPPLVLYVQGRMPAFDDEVAIAMVGSRKVSPYAQMMGEKLAFQMAGLGAVIVSGLAAGGDAAAHRGALRAGGFTAAVIAGGHDVIYPRENRWLYEDIAVRGVILSEYPPGTPHDRTHFPVRNRIISGLCLGTVVIEARSAAELSSPSTTPWTRGGTSLPCLVRRMTGTAPAATVCCGMVRVSWWMHGMCSAATPPGFPTSSNPSGRRSQDTSVFRRRKNRGQPVSVLLGRRSRKSFLRNRHRRQQSLSWTSPETTA